MKFLNLKRKLRNSTLAVLFAAAVMFVMPATAFADDTAVNEEFTDNTDYIYTENAETESTDPLFPDDICYGICCDICDEYCDGTCCELCIINDTDDVNVPDDFEFGLGNEFVDTDEPTADKPIVDGEIDNNIDNNNGSEENGNFGNGIIVDPASGFTNSNENLMPVFPPVFPNEPIFPDDYDDYNNVIVPENPEYVYQPEFGNEPTDGDLTADANEDFDGDSENEEEIISEDDLTEEEEIIFDDDDLTDDEKSETPDDSNSENSDNASGEEDSDNSDEEKTDDTADEENNEDSDNEADENDTDNSDNITDEENSDSENSDNVSDEDDTDDTVDSDNSADDEDAGNSDEENSANTADDENSDDPYSEALEKYDDPVINVVLPASISVAVNPYNLNVVDESGFHYSISSPEYSIKNYSNCGVSIVATVSASTEGGIILSPYDLTGYETEFTAFAYIEATNQSNVYSDNYNNGANQLAFSNAAVSKEILRLDDGSNGETAGYFRIKGQAVIPDGAEYSDQAMLNMVITFDINPISNPVVSDDSVEKETENVENTESSENAENTESSENVENTESSENTENSESSENVENTEDSENTENTEGSENVENSENIENVEEPAA